MPMRSRWTIDIPRVTLPTLLFGSPSGPVPDKAALIDAERPETHVLTHHTYRLWAKRLAAGLRAAGLRPGEAVLLFSGNTLFFPVVVLGVIMAGGIFTGANPTYVAREVAHQLRDSGARFLICADAGVDTGIEAARMAGLQSHSVFVFDDGYATFQGRGKPLKGCRHWSALIADEKAGEAFEWTDGEAELGRTIALNYSSGTTGLPKGVEITHTNYVSNCLQHVHLQTLKPNWDTYQHRARWLCYVPMYHAMAQTIFCVGAHTARIPVYVMRRFELTAMLAAVQRFRITDLIMVPPVVVLLTKSPTTRRYDLSSVECAGSGAAPLGAEVVRAFERLWPDGRVNLQQGYGMTEATCSLLGWDPAKHSDSFGVGEANPNVEVKLMDSDGTTEVLGAGNRGEIWARGPNIMKGYWRNPSATAATLTPDGWLRTGDVAYVDDSGCFFVVDRIKELIKVKGNQVAPAELEALILEHPSIADAAVVGVTINGDELPRAYVVAGGSGVEPQAVAAFIAERVAPHKRLAGGVVLVDAISKNPSGKILRRLYRERAKAEVGDKEGAEMAPSAKL